MYCKDCKFRSAPDEHNYHPFCSNHEKLTDEYHSVTYQPEGNRLVYSYDESGKFYVEDYFGCVHFQANKTFDETQMERLNQGL